ncbi:MAG: molybdopterin-dependent oxidoreductase [Verrucomicrobia bacterium]|nr:molybdopterin-dependent oxidoreductase [Verrucomicrobiota bacterium]
MIRPTTATVVAWPHLPCVVHVSRSAGGVRAILYTLRKAWQAGGWLAFYRRMRTRNACKTCALGMGGQQGGMTNEAGHFPEVCKKSVQAQAADMQAPIAETFFQNHRLDALSRWSARELEYAGRLSFPLFAGPDDRHYRRVSWEEALDRVVARMKATSPERAFFYASGRASNEAAFLLQCLARAWGSNHVNNCSYYCHQASGVGLSRALGTGTGTVSLDDLGKADFVLLIGANPASNHPRLISQLVDLRARGGQVLVVNPLKELGLVRFRVPSKPLSLLFGSRISDLYLQPRVGGDIALLKGMLKHLIEADALDRDFLTNHTTGWSEVEADARHAIFLWAMGITHHAHGVQNVLALVNLAAARGMLGRPGAGLCPIRGHSNVQGVGSVGFAPALKKAFASALEQELGLTLPTHKGFTTYEAMVAAEAGGVDFAFLLGGNLYASNPDLAFAGRALRRIGLTVYVSTKLNQGHFLGRGRESLILPALARDEERQATTQESMFNFVRLSDGGAPSPPGTEMKSEVEIVAALAARLLPPSAIPWTEMTSHAAIRRVIARVVPGYGPMAAVNQFKREFVVEGRVRHAPDFATSDGRVRCFVTPLPGLPEAPDEFALMTIRSEGQFNTVVYEEEDIYRGQERRDVVLMNAEDAGRLGLREDQPLRVESEAGVLEGFRLRYADLARGAAAMYYPEANVVVPRRLDPESGTPAFKSARVRIRPLEARPARVA